MIESGQNLSQQEQFSKNYLIVQKIAEGTYGVVFKVKSTHNGQHYAVKKFKDPDHQGVPTSAVREIHSLEVIDSPYVLKPIRTYALPGAVQMVMEWKDYTLTKLLSSPVPINKKKLIQQILQAVQSIHEFGWLHRDLKPSNIVMSESAEYSDLKLIDFGMAKQLKWNISAKMTNEVGTLFFRAPELLMKSHRYGQQIDVWAVGCIFYQILTKQLLFKSTSQSNQLLHIYEDIATEEQAAKLLANPTFSLQSLNLKHWARIQQTLEGVACEHAVSLLKSMIRINPKERISCEQALSHEYFK